MALGVALLGAGAVAHRHARAVPASGAGRVVGVLDKNPEAARELAARDGIPTVYGRWEELLADPAVDLVAVLLPHDLHCRYAVEALGAGRHVMCEKPLAPTLAEADRMLAAARAAGRQLFVAHNQVYLPVFERCRELIESGAIGDVFLAQSNGFQSPETVSVRPWLATEQGGGGVLMAQAVHPIYVLRWLLGEVVRVSGALAGRIVPMVGEDTAVVTLEFASGALGELTATFAITHGPSEQTMAIFGRDGYLEKRYLQRDDGPPYRLRAASGRLFGEGEIHPVELAPTNELRGADRMWADFARAVEAGATPRVTALDGRKAIEIVLAAYLSARTRRAVDLPL
jgi:UDP-N-acetyl-2-amino-2-deoxyglucuronate dehydrogenase